jgi:hypothetical protein
MNSPVGINKEWGTEVPVYPPAPSRVESGQPWTDTGDGLPVHSLHWAALCGDSKVILCLFPRTFHHSHKSPAVLTLLGLVVRVDRAFSAVGSQVWWAQSSLPHDSRYNTKSCWVPTPLIKVWTGFILGFNHCALEHWLKKKACSGHGEQACNPITWESEAGLWVWGQLGLHSETLSHKNKLVKNQTKTMTTKTFVRWSRLYLDFSFSFSLFVFLTVLGSELTL